MGNLLPAVLLLLVTAGGASAITLDDAVRTALDVSYPLKEQEEVVKRSDYFYLGTIDPYLPRFDLSGSYTKDIGGRPARTSFTTTNGEVTSSRDTWATSGIISYLLFDGGERRARRAAAYSLLGREKERSKSFREEIVFNVRKSFYTALGRKVIVDDRKEAFEIARRIHAWTKGRFDEGVAKKSDVLQAEVRMTTARIEVQNAVSEYEKALEDLKSLLNIDPMERSDVEGALDEPPDMPRYEDLIGKALKERPEVTAQEKEVARLREVYEERLSAFWPKIETDVRQVRADRRFFPEGREDFFGVTLTYPLFDGVGRYYNVKGAQADVNGARFRLEEIKRTVRLEVVKAVKDYEQTRQNATSLRALVREATSNLEQAAGEYKVGKGDIIALLQAERDLAQAKANLTASLAECQNALAFLEKVSYTGRY